MLEAVAGGVQGDSVVEAATDLGNAEVPEAADAADMMATEAVTEVVDTHEASDATELEEDVCELNDAVVAADQSTEPLTDPPSSALTDPPSSAVSRNSSTESSIPTAKSELPEELTKEERALRGLLQFYVCADARRQHAASGLVGAPLQMKYRELIAVGYEVVCNARRHVHDPVSRRMGPDKDGPSNGKATNRTEAAVSSTAIVCEDDYADANGQLVEDDACPASSSGSSPALSKQQLKQHLLAKQQSLAKEMRRLRLKQREQQAVAASSVVAAFGAASTSGAVATRSDGTASAFITVGDADGPTAPPKVAPSRAQTRDEREVALKRKWLDVMEASFEAERLQAKRKALGELRTNLRQELSKLKEERVKAVKLAAVRRDEEAAALSQLRQALNFSEVPLPDISEAVAQSVS